MVLLVALLGAACGGGSDTEPEGDVPATTEPAPEAAEGPVAGSGAGLDPADVEAWCAAVTPDQLAAATDVEVVAVEATGTTTTTCRADVPGSELDVWWGFEDTGKSFESYAGTVVDGRVVQALVSGVVLTDADPGELAEIAQQVLAVYVG